MYNTLFEGLENKDLVFGIMGNIKRESNFDPKIAGDCGTDNPYNIITENNIEKRSKPCVSFGLFGNKLGDKDGKFYYLKYVEEKTGKKFDKLNNTQKYELVTDENKQLAFVIEWFKTKNSDIQKNNPNRNEKEWAAWFAREFERCRDCNTNETDKFKTYGSDEIKERVKAAEEIKKSFNTITSGSG